MVVQYRLILTYKFMHGLIEKILYVSGRTPPLDFFYSGNNNFHGAQNIQISGNARMVVNIGSRGKPRTCKAKKRYTITSKRLVYRRY